MHNIHAPHVRTRTTHRSRAAARASALVGLTVLFGFGMAGQARSAPGGTGDGGGRAGSVTLCHATGSSTNPHVLVTISENGLHGHAHHDGDISPAPPGGCPRATPVTVRQGAHTPRATAAAGAGAAATARLADATPTAAPVRAAVATPSTETTGMRQDVPGQTTFRAATVMLPVAPGAASEPVQATGVLAAAAAPAAPSSYPGETLPRTGGDAATLAICGVGLIVLGAMFRRVRVSERDHPVAEAH